MIFMISYRISAFRVRIIHGRTDVTTYDHRTALPTSLYITNNETLDMYRDARLVMLRLFLPKFDLDG